MATRRERVVLDLESNLPEGMLRGAAATQVLRAELDRLSGSAVRSSRASADIDRDMQKVEKSAAKADRSINQLTGRLRLFADIAAVLGPTLAPLGGAALVGVTTLASQMGFAAVTGGVLIGSMQGLGDALGALNDYHLEPTADNLAAMETELSKLSPAAASFAREAYDLLPALQGIRDAGAEALFPGLTDSLDDLERLAPVVARIFEVVGGAAGEVAASGAASLASDRWADFFRFIADEAPDAISDLASTVGSLTHGLSELWMAFKPLNNDASQWMVDAADGFDRWAQGLAKTEGFRDFISYIQNTGPQVADTLGALANAVVQIVQAAAPVGGAVLAGVEGLANALAAIANSGFGPALLGAAAAMAIFTRGIALMNAVSLSSLAALNPWVLGIGATAGVLLTLEQRADAASAGIERFNAAIEAGDFTEANAEIEAMQKRLDSLKGTDMASLSFSSLGNLLEGKSVQDEIDETTRALEGSKDALADLRAEQDNAASSGAYRRSIEAETAALEKNITAMRAKRDEALRSFSAETNYAQSLLDAKKALEENGRAWNLTTEAGLKNRRIVEAQASAWNELNRTQGQTPAQARQARKALEDTAVSLGATKEEARRYAKQLMDIPNDLKTKIALDVDTAIQRARAIKSELASIDRSIDVYVNVRRPNAGGMGPQVGSYATGGYTGRGGKYEPAGIVHRGEVVLPQEIVNTDWSFLRSRYGHLPGFADGGVVGKARKRRAVGGLFVEDNTAALEDAIRILTNKVEGQTEATERDVAARDKIAQLMSQAGQNTLSNFGLDLFSKSSSPWAAGSGGGALFNLDKQIAGLTDRIGLQQQLASLGLSGNAYSELLKGSNADISGMIARGEIGGYASRFAQYEALSAQASMGAGQYAYGAEFAERDRVAQESAEAQRQSAAALASIQGQLERMQKALADAPELVGHGVGAGLRGEAVKGHRTKKARGGPA